jgi:methyl-accepting chemotaxis protein
VVAQEVKALAAQTARANGEISSQIAGMQVATQESVQGDQAESCDTIGRISQIAATISTSVDQQGAATRRSPATSSRRRMAPGRSPTISST